MNPELDQLVHISRYFGQDPSYVLAGGGNTSYKNNRNIWVKASGVPLAAIREDGFVCLDRARLSKISQKTYPENPYRREEQVKQDLSEAVTGPAHLRPSVETSLHNLIEYAYVVHTHPTLVNGITCSNHALQVVEELFDQDALFMEYCDPGYILFKRLEKRIDEYREMHHRIPGIIFLQNHGVFVSGDSTEEIRKLYDRIMYSIQQRLRRKIPAVPAREAGDEMIDYLSELFQKEGMLPAAFTGSLIDLYAKNETAFRKIHKPFTPDMIVYCRSKYLFVPAENEGEKVRQQVLQFRKDHGFFPRIIIREKGNMIVCGETPEDIKTTKEVFLELMRVSFISENFGGPHFMTDDQIAFIENWEVEQYRRNMAKRARS